MSTALTLSSHQNLSISPRLQQAVRLLQLSAADFEQELHDTLSSNPFLDESDEQKAVPEVATDMPAYGFADDGPPPFDGPLKRAHVRSGEEESGTDLSWAPETRGLRDHLRTQLYASRQDARTTLAAEVLIETLDDDGYLRDDVSASLRAVDTDPPLSTDDMARALRLVQTFDPAGVAARNLAECLRLQLAVVDGDATVRRRAAAVLDEHVELLARQDLKRLSVRLDCDQEAVRAAIHLIRGLDPHPGSRYAATGPDYVIPDVLVVLREGRYATVINPAVRPRATLNQRYVELLRSCGRGRHAAMTAQLQEARWFLRNVEQRFDTIQRVADHIVHKQADFFRYGDVALKPMVLREVADALELHESTVSRATGNKFMLTPRGCLPFKLFFSRELPMRAGPACSAAAVRALIRQMISEEGSGAPMSDVDIARKLRNQGIGIARRTVSKYRKILRLPPADRRRKA